MSNLLFGIAGAAIGSAFGMPALGFALGSGVGSALGGHHHAPSPLWPGARLNDLKVQTSTYGIGIPHVYGIYRLAGNVIWATDILEAKDSAGHYTYYGNFAIGLCAGPIAGIRRIWADGKEIFKRDNAHLRAQPPNTLRYYLGDEQQLADPLIEAHQGKGQTPAFRGLAYVVFEHFPLANFTNRLPSVTVEIVQSAVALPPVAPEPVAVAKSIIHHGRGVQKRSRSRITIPTESQPPVEEKKQVLATVPLATIVTDLCVQAGFTLEAVDASLLNKTRVTGFVLSPPTSAREALALLQRAYGFDVVESGAQFYCVPRKMKKPLFVPIDTLVQEEGADNAQPVMTCLPSLELPQQVTVFFTEADKDYRLATQTAQRAEAQGHGSERIELPLVLSQEEAALMTERILAEREENRTQLRFTLPRAYAVLEPSDRLLLNGSLLRVLSVAYGSPGLVKIQAALETGFISGGADKA